MTKEHDEQDGREGVGASLRDRAVVNGAGQAVSALRASVPSAARVRTMRDVIRAVPGRFAGSYGSGRELLASWKAGWTRGQIIDALNALDTDTCTPDEVNAIIGTKWAENECDICDNRDCDIVMQIGEEPDYEARWQDICLPCLVNLGSLAAQAIEARRAATAQTGSVHESAVAESHAPATTPEPSNG